MAMDDGILSFAVALKGKGVPGPDGARRSPSGPGPGPVERSGFPA